ncbi:MAG TPA: phytanoyl-CoA dioxygenase family protein [Chthonomonadaceae bacterium]|nr:phytanoyl-CoA dioxygenase family protein [Chthonomonadaceae bacterium]
MTGFRLRGDQVARFDEQGYLIVPALLSAEETAVLAEVARLDQALISRMALRKDAQGGTAQLALDNTLSDTIYSAIVQSERLVRAMETLLGGEVYHYHHKVSAKQPYEGGAWEWHQDYGYWYNNGCLFPYMASCYIAIDRANRENGCMQLLAGSHKMGRIEHGKTGDQTGADMERVNAALERMALIYAEMEPGDGLFFHCNTLHRSDQNRSPYPRWGLICCYNAARNDPYMPGPHPNYSPLDVLPDTAILETGRRQLERLKAQS